MSEQDDKPSDKPKGKSKPEFTAAQLKRIRDMADGKA